MNKKSIVLLALTCGLGCTDAAGSFFNKMADIGSSVKNFSAKGQAALMDGLGAMKSQIASAVKQGDGAVDDLAKKLAPTFHLNADAMKKAIYATAGVTAAGVVGTAVAVPVMVSKNKTQATPVVAQQKTPQVQIPAVSDTAWQQYLYG